MPNNLYFGDNLDICRRHVADESVDLIYLDPPFNSKAQYNLLFATPQSERASAQAEAFHDTWVWGDEARDAFAQIMQGGDPVAKLTESLQSALGHSDVMAYLVMMAIRLSELRDKLKSTGSLYLHCDPTASHYLKVILDSVFGPKQFRNEIIWKRTFSHSGANKFAPVHDVILYYTKSSNFIWNKPRVPYAEEYLEKYYRFDDGDGRLYWRDNLCAAGTRKGESGKPWRGIDPAAKGMHWKYQVGKLDELDAEGRIYWPARGTMPQYKRYRDELKGLSVSDIWEDIDRINPVSIERTGYPTQKPVALLERILEASSDPGSVVLDPFCGCGTTVAAAEKLGRKWIGVDISVHAIKVIEARLQRSKAAPHHVEGMPRDFDSAAMLAEKHPYQFQWWANYLFNPHAIRNQKKGADKGIDGEIYFPNGPGRAWGKLLISVKGGQNVRPSDVRDFGFVLSRENAQMGLFVCLKKPTAAMIAEAYGAGDADTVHGSIPKLQIVSIQNWFDGVLPRLPPLEHLPISALSTARRRLPKSPCVDPRMPQLPLVFAGGKSDKTQTYLNPAMVFADDELNKKTG